MAINYTWKITALKKSNSGDLENVIIGTDGNVLEQIVMEQLELLLEQLRSL